MALKDDRDESLLAFATSDSRPEKLEEGDELTVTGGAIELDRFGDGDNEESIPAACTDSGLNYVIVVAPE